MTMRAKQRPLVDDSIVLQRLRSLASHSGSILVRRSAWNTPAEAAARRVVVESALIRRVDQVLSVVPVAWSDALRSGCLGMIARPFADLDSRQLVVLGGWITCVAAATVAGVRLVTQPVTPALLLAAGTLAVGFAAIRGSDAIVTAWRERCAARRDRQPA
jgi:hypothetical protein